ncbi:MFS transporter [Stutzerimonas zhaodongensis]|uniref:MFS transporter n=1 Tax=Stutzerimonas zhaodongensis TaxID=1176257 RepID=UPI00210712F3|nr:MFS transporter [Stutzerimonas zhaodongensis]MCQ2031338.1 MFS transporter [Stutzerimonas zhaodongensis]
MFLFANEYLLAWSAYGIAALGCLLVWFRITRPMWRWLREPLRLIMAVLLLTPTIVDPAKEMFAPAVAITALDLLFKVGNNAWRAVADLALYGLIAFALYALFVGLRFLVERRRPQGRSDSSDDEDPRTLRERLEEDEDDDYRPASRYQTRTEPRL